MTDAPERIWLDPVACFGRSRSTAVANAITKARGKAWETDAEYIRLDLHEAAVAAARAEAEDWKAIAMRLRKAGDALAQACDDGEPTLELVNAWDRATPPVRPTEASK